MKKIEIAKEVFDKVSSKDQNCITDFLMEQYNWDNTDLSSVLLASPYTIPKRVQVAANVKLKISTISDTFVLPSSYLDKEFIKSIEKINSSSTASYKHSYIDDNGNYSLGAYDKTMLLKKFFITNKFKKYLPFEALITFLAKRSSSLTEEQFMNVLSLIISKDKDSVMLGISIFVTSNWYEHLPILYAYRPILYDHYSNTSCHNLLGGSVDQKYFDAILLECFNCHNGGSLWGVSAAFSNTALTLKALSDDVNPVYNKSNYAKFLDVSSNNLQKVLSEYKYALNDASNSAAIDRIKAEIIGKGLTVTKKREWFKIKLDEINQ